MEEFNLMDIVLEANSPYSRKDANGKCLKCTLEMIFEVVAIYSASVSIADNWGKKGKDLF